MEAIAVSTNSEMEDEPPLGADELLDALLRDSPAPPETESSKNDAAVDEIGSAKKSPEEFHPDPEAGLEVAGPPEVSPDVPGVTPAPAEPEPPSPPAVAEAPAAVEEGATTAPGELVIRVEVPADAKPGQQLRVTLPSGKQALVAVPAQAAPGTCLRVTVRVDDDAGGDDEAAAPAAAPADEAPAPPPAATGDADARRLTARCRRRPTVAPPPGSAPPVAASASPKPLFSFAPPANAPAMERETSSGTADALAALAALSAADDEGADGGPLWVSCDECGKWRRVAELPPADGLPWTCAMNLDDAHNACSIPQELPDDEVDRQMARYHARQASAGALMGGAASIMGGAEPLDRPIVLEAARALRRRRRMRRGLRRRRRRRRSAPTAARCASTRSKPSSSAAEG